MAKELPGPDFQPGKLKGSTNWWNNEIIQIRQKDNPGPGWKRGSLPKG